MRQRSKPVRMGAAYVLAFLLVRNADETHLRPPKTPDLNFDLISAQLGYTYVFLLSEFLPMCIGKLLGLKASDISLGSFSLCIWPTTPQGAPRVATKAVLEVAFLSTFVALPVQGYSYLQREP